MLPITLVGNILRGILPARLQIILLVKLYAILRARLQVMLLVIILAVSGARLQVMLLVMVRARWRCATPPCNVMHKIACKHVSDTNSYVMHNIACEVASGATYNFTRHIACKVARVTMCDCMCKYCIQGCNYCYMFFNVERNIAYKVASDVTSKATTAKTRHILLIKTTVASSFQKDSWL